MNLVLMQILEYLNNPKISDVDKQIAQYVVRNHYCLNHMSIQMMSNDIGVSLSQMSRFVRRIGFDSFTDFKESLDYHGNKNRHSLLQKENSIKDEYEYKNIVQKEIDYFFEYFSIDCLEELVNDLLHYKTIGMFGLLNSENALKDLQYNLALKGIFTTSYSFITNQNEYIKNADSETLIIIYSLSGAYVLDNDYSSYYQTLTYLKKCKAKIYVFTNNRDVFHLSYIDKVIYVPVYNQLHNYSLQCLNDCIMLAIDRLFLKMENKLIKS